VIAKDLPIISRIRRTPIIFGRSSRESVLAMSMRFNYDSPSDRDVAQVRKCLRILTKRSAALSP